MGVESGGGGGRRTRSPQSKNQRGRPPQKLWHFSIFFLDTYANFAFVAIFKTKWLKSEEKLNFGGRWVWVPMNPSPQTKLRSNALLKLMFSKWFGFLCTYVFILDLGIFEIQHFETLKYQFD